MSFRFGGYNYHADGRIASKTTWRYDSEGSIQSTTVTHYEYNADGRMDSETTWEYDSEGSIQSTTVTHYEYNHSGQLVEKLEEREHSKYSYRSANLTEYAYDKGILTAEKRLYKQDDEDYEIASTTTYSNFDNDGNPRHAEIVYGYNSITNIDYIYDAYGNVLVETGVSIDDYSNFSTTWEYTFKYVPIKKSSLSPHWSEADEYIYWDGKG